jgi:DNA replication licensing factor MCM7
MFVTISQYENTSTELVSRIRNNARRYVNLFSEVVDKLMPEPTKDISDQDEVIDVILHQRRERNETLQPGQNGFPDHLLRR